MPSTHKKVVVRKMDRDSLNGYVATANYVHDGKLELLNTAGNVVAIELRDAKLQLEFTRITAPVAGLTAFDCSVTAMSDVMPSGGGKPKSGLYRNAAYPASRSSLLVTGIAHDP